MMAGIMKASKAIYNVYFSSMPRTIGSTQKSVTHTEVRKQAGTNVIKYAKCLLFSVRKTVIVQSIIAASV